MTAATHRAAAGVLRTFMPRRSQPLSVSRVPRRWRTAFFLLAVLAVVLFRLAQSTFAPPAPSAQNIQRVERVVDGDTLLLANGQRVRLIGVNTPETVKEDWPVEPFGPEAKAFTADFIRVAGGQVRLEFDGDSTDQFGRLLAYVYAADGRMLNAELLRAGLARATLGYRFAQTMKARFRREEAEAKAAARGIWSAEAAAAR